MIHQSTSENVFHNSQLFEGFGNEPLDLILVQAPWWAVEMPPLGLATLAGFVRQHGFSVRALDLNIETYRNVAPEEKAGWKLEEAYWRWADKERTQEFIEENQEYFEHYIRLIADAKPAVVGFSVQLSSAYVTLYFAERLKELIPDTVIVCGGPQASRVMSGYALANKDFIDVVTHGEGELTLVEILERVKAGQGFEGCAGVLYCEDGNIVDCGDRPLIRPLSSLPDADFSDFDFQIYDSPNKLPLETSRGCVNKCHFCNEHGFWVSYRGVKGDRLFAQVQAQVDKYPFIEHIVFQDDLINGWPKELERFADRMLESGLKLTWHGQGIIRKEMTFNYMKKLHDAGCTKMSFGLETASTRLWSGMGKYAAKGTDLDTLVRDAYLAGLRCTYNFMFGLPGETEDDFQMTLDFLRRNKDYLATIDPSPHLCTFSPGSIAYDNADQYGITEVESLRYWEADDGANTLPLRLQRFETLCGLADDLGINSYYPSRKLLDRERCLADYYYYKKDYDRAASYYQEWLDRSPNDKVSAHKLADCSERLATAD